MLAAQPQCRRHDVITIQGAGATSLGTGGGGLGYAGIPKSVAIKFDLFSNNGEGDDSTGFFTNGSYPSVPGPSDPNDFTFDLTPTGINLHSEDVLDVTVKYNGSVLTATILDTDTGFSATASGAINIPAPSAVTSLTSDSPAERAG